MPSAQKVWKGKTQRQQFFSYESKKTLLLVLKVFAQNFGNAFLKTFNFLCSFWKLEINRCIIFKKFEKNTADFKLFKELIFMLISFLK